MIWKWYSARDNELFIDMDRYKESINHVCRRLQGAMETGALEVENTFFTASSTFNHMHLIIILKKPLRNRYEAYAWEMILHGDIYRAASNILRESRGVPNPDILISKINLHRLPDAECNCISKHKRSTMLECDAAKLLRGEKRLTTFFGKPSENRCIFLGE
jgi:hypothetical protein